MKTAEKPSIAENKGIDAKKEITYDETKSRHVFENIAICNKFDEDKYEIRVKLTGNNDRIVNYDIYIDETIKNGKVSISLGLHEPTKTSTIKVKVGIYKTGESQPVCETGDITLTVNPRELN